MKFVFDVYVYKRLSISGIGMNVYTSDNEIEN